MESIIFGIALSLTSATQTRLGGVGLGEAILALLVVVSIFRLLVKKTKSDSFMKILFLFFISSFIFLFIGFLVFNTMNIDRSLIGEDSTRITINVLPFVFCFFVVFIVGSSESKFLFCQKTALSYAVFTTLSQILLWIYSVFISESILGITLFDSRFQSWSSNPNQIAFIMLGVPFILFYFFQKKLAASKKTALLILIIFSVFIGFQSASDALSLAWGFGIVLLSLLSLYRNWQMGKSFLIFSNFFTNIILPSFIGFSFVVVGVLNFDTIATKFLDTANYGNQTSDRELLWQNGLDAWQISPIFGLGPGAFSGFEKPFEGQESHNSFIEWLSNVGIFGFIFYLGIIVIVFRICLVKKSYTTLAMLISFCVFIQFHYVLRQPIHWIYLVFVYYLAQNIPVISMEKRNVWDTRL